MLQILNFAHTPIFGPSDEQNIQNIQQYTLNVVSDSAGILSTTPTITNSGTLDLAFTLNTGTAIVEIQMQDDGGTNFGGIDTSMAKQFSIIFTDFIFDDGFETPTTKQLQSLISHSKIGHLVTYDKQTDSLVLPPFSLPLNNDYDSQHTLLKVQKWLDELSKVLLY